MKKQHNFQFAIQESTRHHLLLLDELKSGFMSDAVTCDSSWEVQDERIVRRLKTKV